jgi:hypothetical protein
VPKGAYAAAVLLVAVATDTVLVAAIAVTFWFLTGVSPTGSDAARDVQLVLAGAAMIIGLMAGGIAAVLLQPGDVPRGNKAVFGRGIFYGTLRVVALVLPSACAVRYAEEWQGELYDLAAEGTGILRRSSYVASIVFCAVPMISVRLRIVRRKP